MNTSAYNEYSIIMMMKMVPSYSFLYLYGVLYLTNVAYLKKLKVMK